MFKPLFAFIGYRYSRVKRKNHFISFISMTSMLGIALGVTVLITVLSVMNGFSKEIRAKMLSIAPHITFKSGAKNLNNWNRILQDLKKYPKVVGAAPFILEQGMLTSSGKVNGVAVRGILPQEINEVFPLKNSMIAGSLDSLQSKSYSVVIGIDLASKLGVWLNDKVTLLIPEASVSPAGVMPRLKRFTVAGIFDTQTYYDNNNIFVHLNDAATLYRIKNNISGIQLKLEDELYSRSLAKQISVDFNNDYFITDWTYEYQSFFEAIKMEKTVMWCILLLIIAVAGFNLVSSLVMMVTDKRPDIAILRTMGVSRRSVMGIFMMQGSIIGIIGTMLGLIFGLLLAYNVTEIVAFIQKLFQVQFISPDVYFIGYVPSDIQTLDISLVCFLSLLMSFLSTIYPAFRAASIKPAEALRYE